MKKTRILSLLLAFAMLSVLLCPTAFAGASQIVDSMSVNAGSALLVDLDTDNVLFGQNENEIIFPASTTKILTALVVLRHIEAGDLSMNTTVTCSDTFRKNLTADAAVAGLQTGEKISIECLLYCLMLPSACDAANVLGEAVSGDLEAFGKEMNRVAEEVGCTDSHFVNPSGLHNNDHYTTCMDLYRIMKAALAYDDFRKIIATPHITIAATNMSGPRTLNNTNALLKGTKTNTYTYPGCIGGKTGSTYLAGYCLASAAKRDGKTLVCIMMGCNWLINRDGSRDKLQFSESVRLYDWGFESFTTKDIVEEGSVVGSIPVTLSLDGSAVEAVTTQSISAEVPKDVEPEDFEVSLSCPEQLEAPVNAGDSLGSATYLLDGKKVGTVELVAAKSLALDPEIQRQRDREAWLSANAGKLKAAVIIVVLMILLLVLRMRISRRRRRRKRRPSTTRHKSTTAQRKSSTTRQRSSRSNRRR